MEQIVAAVAAEHGVRCDEPVVIGRHSNLLVHLAPAPVVARVPTETAALHTDIRAWLTREVEVAAFAAAAGAAVVAPSDLLPPGPHERDGVWMTFWRFVDHDPDRPLDPAELGRSLRELHDALAGYGGELPLFTGALREIEQMLAPLGPEADPLRAELDRLAPLMLETKLPMQPLHGDASVGNLLRAPDGLLWTDFEDVCTGPVALELAGLAVSAEMRGHGPEFIAAILHGYGGTLSEEQLEPFARLGALYATAWTSNLVTRRPELRDVAAARFEWWRRRVGGHSARPPCL